MYYVYFLFCGYRVAIGKAKNLHDRLGYYRRTHLDVFTLGVIPCQSDNDARKIERECLKRFKNENAFRDMFYLSAEMRIWIVENTEDYEKYAEADYEACKKGQRKRWHQRYKQDREFREKERERDKERSQDPKRRERQRKRHQERWKKDREFREKERERDRRRDRSHRYNDPNYREKERKRNKERNLRRRKKRPSSPHTLKIPGL